MLKYEVKLLHRFDYRVLTPRRYGMYHGIYICSTVSFTGSITFKYDQEDVNISNSDSH